MKNKNKIFLIVGIILIFVVVYQARSSYAKYISGTQSGANMEIARWNFKINNQDINNITEPETGEKTKVINEDTIKILVDEKDPLSQYYSDKILAPGRIGYFEADIDYSDVTVPFTYEITAENDSGNKNIIEYIKVIEDTETEETTEEMLAYLESIRTRPNSLNNPLVDKRQVKDENDNPIDPSKKKIKVKIFVIWKEASNSFVDNSFSGSALINYKITFKFVQTNMNPDETPEPEPIPPDNPLDIGDRTNIMDNDGDSKISFGDIVTLGTEQFYVTDVDSEHDSVFLLSRYNLNVGNYKIPGETEGLQDENCLGDNKKCTIEFAEPDYTKFGTPYWFYNSGRYPSEVYSPQSLLYDYVDKYEKKLNDLGYTFNIKLMLYEDVIKICNGSGHDSINCDSAPDWFLKTSFWTGTAASRYTLWTIDGKDGIFNGDKYERFFNRPKNYFSNDNTYGIRPYIIIDADKIK